MQTANEIIKNITTAQNTI